MVMYCFLSEKTIAIANNNCSNVNDETFSKLQKAIAVKFTPEGAAKITMSNRKNGNEIWCYKDQTGLVLTDQSIVRSFVFHDRDYCVKCLLNGFDKCRNYVEHEKDFRLAGINQVLREKMYFDKGFGNKLQGAHRN